jgi:hypothetical protein
MCRTCDGVGHVWRYGGPRFGAKLELGKCHAGEVVELATGDRARVLWHMPRKNPATTFVALIDSFDDTVAGAPPPRDHRRGGREVAPDAPPVDSRLGVLSVATKAVPQSDDYHEGEKDSDAVDPIARRTRAHGGPLL